MSRTATGALAVAVATVSLWSTGLGSGTASAAVDAAALQREINQSVASASAAVTAGVSNHAGKAAAAKAPKPAPAPAPATAAAAPAPSSDGRGKSLGSFELTCYSLSGTTASGAKVSESGVAVDPRVIKLGTRLYIEGLGWKTATDTGGAIKGKIIDIWNPSSSWCRNFGRQQREVWLAA